MTFKAGKQEGPAIQWNEAGQKVREIPYAKDNINGKAIYWHENGQKSAEIMYVDGKRQGKIIQWFEDGKLELEGEFSADKEAGLWNWYNDIGQIVQQTDHSVYKYEGETAGSNFEQFDASPVWADFGSPEEQLILKGDSIK